MGLAIAEVDVLAGGAVSIDRLPALLLLTAGIAPIGRAELNQPLESGHVPANVITVSHADAALRAGLSRLLADPASPPIDVRNAVIALGRMGEAPAGGAGPTVTVAVCSRDRPAQLARAVRAIASQLGADDELVIVNNSGTGDLQPIGATLPGLRVVHEPRPGLDWARNRAIGEARNEIVAFCDDDCVPGPHWLGELRALFRRNPETDAVTGLVWPLALETPAQRLFERYRGFDRGYQRLWITAPDRPRVAGAVGNTGRYGTGANLAVKRATFDRIGGFDTALDAGTVTGGGGDLELLFRLLKRGGMLAYSPACVVRHEHRRDMPALVRQIETWGSGFACAAQAAAAAFPEERGALRMLHGRIVLLHHARRLVFSPHIRRLVMAELVGMRGASARYAESRRVATVLGSDATSSGPGAVWARLNEHRPESQASARAAALARENGREVAISADLDGSIEPLRVDRPASGASITVRWRGRTIGEVRVPIRGDCIGVDRLRDAVVDQLGNELLGTGWKEAVRETRRLLVAAGRDLSRDREMPA